MNRGPLNILILEKHDMLLFLSQQPTSLLHMFAKFGEDWTSISYLTKSIAGLTITVMHF